ncbi:LuxR family transcriptional regulator [Amycolatopsis sp. WAC 04197]|uniref:helix-turn-helix transcriptional regulator n=1 Tax=Amycolatopsis sp. WAC 04197 TaxID=2203199 RepID=UPI000F76849F|nr:helix-turn-helix transcriptional regulator [Amycolatopsis sp. WAC 04197]RSN39719.1 LuxR family transcriptional regulator [Amycolatopsis sp. WAC 04197]
MSPVDRLAPNRGALAELARLGRWSEANDAAMEAVRRLQAEPAGVLASELADLVYVAGGPRPGQVPPSSERLVVPEERGLAMRALSVVNRIGRLDEATEAAEAALSSPGRWEVGTFWYAVLALVYADHLDSARTHCARAVHDASRSGSERHRHAAAVLHARVAFLTGDSATAANRFALLLDDGVHPQQRGLVVAWAVAALIDLGDLESAGELLRENGLTSTLDNEGDRAEVLWARGLLHEAVDRPQAAFADFMACGRELLKRSVINPAVIPWRSAAARNASATERADIALALAREEVVEAHRWGAPNPIGRALGVDALITDSYAEADPLRTAAALLETGGASADLRNLWYTFGAKLSLERHFDAGEEAFAAARQLAVQAGNRFWTERIDAALRNWSEGGGYRELSRQDFRVAYLARLGFGNKDIAGRLHVSLRTVELCLSTVYRKLGISRRDGLRSVLFPPL